MVEFALVLLIGFSGNESLSQWDTNLRFSTWGDCVSHIGLEVSQKKWYRMYIKKNDGSGVIQRVVCLPVKAE